MSEITLSKIAIHQTVNEKVDQALTRINQEFDGGRVSKTDFMSWILENGIEKMNDTVIAEIRKAHFNQTVYLESLVKKLRSAKREKMSTEEIATLQKILSGGQQKRLSNSKIKKQVDLEPKQLVSSTPHEASK